MGSMLAKTGRASGVCGDSIVVAGLRVATCALLILSGAAFPALGASPGKNGAIFAADPTAGGLVRAGSGGFPNSSLVLRAAGTGEVIDPDWVDRDPLVSPDGNRLAFSRCPPATVAHCAVPGAEVWVADVDGGNARRLTTGVVGSWSPDGQTLAFVDVVPDRRKLGIWLIGAEGGASRLLLAAPAACSDDLGGIAWSARGDPVLFSCAGAGRFYLASADTGRGRLLLDLSQVMRGHLFAARGYDWSPDGKQLALSLIDRRGSHSADIFLFTPGQRTLLNLTRSAGTSETEPLFSPDGRTIAFVRDDGELWTMDIRGKGRRHFGQLYGATTLGRLGSWQPCTEGTRRCG
jgi:Tol biopolymer transport system component